MTFHQIGQTDPSNCYAYNLLLFLLLLFFFFIFIIFFFLGNEKVVDILKHSNF